MTYLDLYDYNQTGDEGAKTLAAGVAVSGSLTKLGLGCNKIGDEGAKALAAAVAASSSLSTLALCNNMIGDEGAYFHQSSAASALVERLQRQVSLRRPRAVVTATPHYSRWDDAHNRRPLVVGEAQQRMPALAGA